ncbi:AAA family ATPase [Variovorax paradoxus]|uniref:AAA family ATPase n=1 Tax=Variovorax paradoxus TaxID=34073 RepID=UPI001ABC8FA0
MNLIPDNIDLSEYMDTPDFRAKVRSAMDFRDAVREKLRHKPDGQSEYGSQILIGKARNTIFFKPKHVTAWVGYNGHRKSMFTSQVALDMAVQGERVLIVSLEMDPDETMGRMTRQATGSATPSDILLNRFYDWSDGRLWLFDHIGTISVDHAFALCRYFSQELGGTHVVLDSMMMICTSEERLDEQKYFSTGLIRLAQETGLHVHVITHCRKPNGVRGEKDVPSRYEIRGSSAISDQAHNVVAVWMNKAKYERLEENPNDLEAQGEPCAIVKVDKQRGSKWEGKLSLWHHEPSLRFCGDRTSPVEPYPFLTNELEIPDDFNYR